MTTLSPADLSRSIERCATSADVSRLKEEVQLLKTNGDGRARFAAALFELELARKGDAECRGAITRLAEVLLVFWQDGSGQELSKLHPSVERLWQSVTPMLVQFELRRFELGLVECWKQRTQAPLLKVAIENLGPAGNQRVEFARCLYHLELARQGVESSRAKFAQRAGLLAEAYRDSAFAAELVGKDAGLLQLWSDLKPYLDEFFEHLEEQAARTQQETDEIRPVPNPEESAHQPAVETSSPQIQPAHPRPSEKRTVDPPPPPSNITPPGSWVLDADAEVEVIEDVPPKIPPAPPTDLTPPGSWRRPSEELEIVEPDLAAPPAPPQPQQPNEDDQATPFAEDFEVDFEPEPSALAFWDYTFASLQQPAAGSQQPRMLASESRADRKRLTTWLDGLGGHLAVPEGRAMAALVRLMLASEAKEKSLFGQANPRRKEALEAALALLAPTPEAAGRAAVWFELDGSETRQSLGRGLELLQAFLAYCSRNNLDPLSGTSVSKYLAS